MFIVATYRSLCKGCLQEPWWLKGSFTTQEPTPVWVRTYQGFTSEFCLTCRHLVNWRISLCNNSHYFYNFKEGPCVFCMFQKLPGPCELVGFQSPKLPSSLKEGMFPFGGNNYTIFHPLFLFLPSSYILFCGVSRASAGMTWISDDFLPFVAGHWTTMPVHQFFILRNFNSYQHLQHTAVGEKNLL